MTTPIHLRAMSWQDEYLESIKQMSNEDLFDEYRYTLQGDGWDGMSSKANDWRREQSWNLLKERFIQCGFFKPE